MTYMVIIAYERKPKGGRVADMLAVANHEFIVKRHLLTVENKYEDIDSS